MAKLFKFMLLAAVLLVSGNLCAQAVWQDVVHCKNGSVIKGTIIEQIPNESIKIQTADGNIFVYKMSEVDKMTKEQLQTTNLASVIGISKTTDDLCNQAKIDAKKNYAGAGSLWGVTYLTTFLTGPLFGLIPASIGASSDLDESKLNYPSVELWKNSDYKKCYTDEAKKIKKNSAWTAYGVPAGLWVLLGLPLLFLL